MDTETHEYVAELLQAAADRVTKAEKAVEVEQRARRIDAAIAVRHGYGKGTTAAALGISRPTLDAWLGLVEGTAAEQREVDQHFEFADRRAAKAAERKAARGG
ncbi:hypothetical protein [Amycolatopsis eburnea]|uniref:Uncharacterized protein n=1 Tax=Amycolatopsis eburnea TaxID=2267691 RepID=A0A3R9F0F6_9PSEU|nr:hypothetical protein [Amycolatopsis eburnea]RSD26336.1 hypothetical protein EIY87_00285 [Amycolatopsis eburnea]